MPVDWRSAIFPSLALLAVLFRTLNIVEAKNLQSATASQLGVHDYRQHPIQAYSKKKRARCDSQYPYRLMDGQCNNLKNPNWGSAFSPLIRLLPNAYKDGKSQPRSTGVDNNPLPTARQVSIDCHTPNNATSDITVMLVHWGAFIVLDIVQSPSQPDNCTCDSKSSECYNIPLSKTDEFYEKRECLPVTRINALPRSKGDKSAREQFNIVTSFLDSSNIYGNSEAELKALRLHSANELRVLTVGQMGDFMPPDTCQETCKPGRGEYCFLSGSDRVNLVPGLAILHTLFVREHNRIAKYLRVKTPSAVSDETIFQETRKIVGAIFQHISYTEFLPVILGAKVVKREKLKVNDYNYDTSCQPGLSHGFSSAAFRFGHSLIPESVTLPNIKAVVPLQDLFWNPSPVFQLFGQVLKVLTTQKGKGVNRHFSHSVSRHLFPEIHGEGRDLAALNIQRGREQGLPSYNTYRHHLGLGKMKSLEKLFAGDKKAASVYKHIDDVDLFTGGLAEAPSEGSMLGPTFTALLADQFKRLMNGDRFFYLNDDKHIRFTRGQLGEIAKVKLSKVICDNTNENKIQKKVFRPISGKNKLTDCTKLKGMNLKLWVDELKKKL